MQSQIHCKCLSSHAWEYWLYSCQCLAWWGEASTSKWMDPTCRYESELADAQGHAPDESDGCNARCNARYNLIVYFGSRLLHSLRGGACLGLKHFSCRICRFNKTQQNYSWNVMEWDPISDSFVIILQYRAISHLWASSTFWPDPSARYTPWCGQMRGTWFQILPFAALMQWLQQNVWCLARFVTERMKPRSSLLAAWVQNVQGQSDVRLEASARRVFKQCRMLTAERQLSVNVCWCLEFAKAGNLVPPVKNTEKDWASVLWSIYCSNLTIFIHSCDGSVIEVVTLVRLFIHAKTGFTYCLPGRWWHCVRKPYCTTSYKNIQNNYLAHLGTPCLRSCIL